MRDLHNSFYVVSETAIEKRMAEYRSLAKDFASAQADRVRLEEFKRPKLAILMQKAAEDGHKTTAAQEREAYADPEYSDIYLAGLSDAVERAERLRYMLKAMELELELYRTAEASKRAEMRGYR